MTVTILVATPHAPFGELLRMSLEDSGQYHVRLVPSAHEARAAAGRLSFQLAIVDSALTDEPFVQLCKDLLNSQAGLRLVIIPPENNPSHPALGDLLPHGYLSRPFYLPDLINTVARLLSERESELRQVGDLPAAAALSVTLPPWLQEPLTLNTYLQKELAGTQALAGMVGAVGVKPGQGQLRASAGQLTDEAAEELAGVVFRYWKCDEKTDLMRFIRLSADKHDYLVYATPITGSLVLILAYDTNAPLSQIRPQTKDMAQTLAGLPPDGYHQANTPASESIPENGKVAESVLPPVEWTEPEEKSASAESALGAESPQAAEVPVEWADSSAVPTPQAPPPWTEAPAAIDTAKQVKPEIPAAQEPASSEDAAQNTAKEAAQPSIAAQDEPHTQPLQNTLYDNRARSGFYPVEPPDPFEEEPGPELDVINLAALLGAIPSPDPEGFAPNNNGWQARPASAAIPTLPGGLNGWEHIEGPGTDELPDTGHVPTANSAPITPADVVESDEEFLAMLQMPAKDVPQQEPSAGQESAAEQEPLVEQQQETAETAQSQIEEPPQPRKRITRPLDMPGESQPQAQASPAEDWAYAWAESENQTEESRSPAENVAAAEAPVEEQAKPEQPTIYGSRSLWTAELPAWPVDHPAPKDAEPTAGYSITPRSEELDLSIEPPPDPLEDTRPRVIATINQLDQLEPVSPALSLLNYTCVLVPRFPNHYLIGDLADRLSAWVAQICVAFGWRLEGIAVRPEYLQWSVQVAPAVSPGNLVRILRQRTSLHIFSAFPQFAAQNPSGDFWATGYLIVSGPQPPSAQLLRDYIVQTRKRQGLQK